MTDAARYVYRMHCKKYVYELDAEHLSITQRVWLQRNTHRYPLESFSASPVTWTSANQYYIAIVAVSVLSIALGIWGICDPRNTGMYWWLGALFIAAGIIAPIHQWPTRLFCGVTYWLPHGQSFSINAYGTGSSQYHDFVAQVQQQIETMSSEQVQD